jgi:hypothetical protein
MAASMDEGLGDLPVYVLEPARRRRVRPVPVPRVPGPPTVPPPPVEPWTRDVPLAGTAPRTNGTVRAGTGASPLFRRLLDVPRDDLAAVVTAWWAATAVDGRAKVGRRLRIGTPVPVGGGWRLPARVRRLGWPLSVVIELLPQNERFTHLTMTPQMRVVTTRHYFAIGNRAFDRLGSELVRFQRRLASTRGSNDSAAG